MNALEWRAVAALGMVYALRMIGMFMVLPVFALYARDLPGGASHLQVGLAVGIYGLTQALLQIPFGMASDRFGRKPVIFVGLAVFALGSVVAGHADSIDGVIAGRLLQGAGAVSSAVAALLADVTREQVRTTAMALLGAGMGLAFILALVLGPVVSLWIGVDGIFFLTAVLVMLALPVVGFGVPTPQRPVARAGGFGLALRNPQLLRLNFGIFLLHATMIGLFVAAPVALLDTLELGSTEQWKVYVPVLLLSVLPVFPVIRWAEARGRTRLAYRGAIGLLAVAMVIAALGHAHGPWLLLAMLLFFIPFNYLEGALPSMISRRAPAESRGAALGVYATAQFLGAFAGGSVVGLAHGYLGLGGAFAACAAMPIIWFLIPDPGERRASATTVPESPVLRDDHPPIPSARSNSNTDW